MISRHLHLRSPLAWSGAFIVLLTLVWGANLVFRQSQGGAEVELATLDAAGVSAQTCAECHAEQFAAWQGSYHDLAMQEATKETVLGDFGDVQFTEAGVTSRFFEKDGRFFINTQGPDGTFADFQVAYTFGVAPLQQYLLEFPDGSFQAFSVAWDVENQKWFSLYPDEEILPNDPLHWAGRRFTWNSSCAECHSTDLQLNFDGSDRSYHTTWAELDVSCQACHGPGADHVAWARQTESQRSGENGLAVDLKELTSQAQVESCAPCHSRRYPISPNDRFGEPFLDHFMPELLGQGLYHPDGQILDEVYVYGSFLQSRMYQQGVGCTDCHNPHTLELRAQGNQLCTACHQMNPPLARFPTLAAKTYDSPAHTFHQQGTPGAMCVDCHMPEQTYMVVDPRRDHSLRIPRPDLSISLGTPNACTQCHLERSPEWAVAAMKDWYGTGWQKPHYGETLAAGRLGAEGAAHALIALLADPAQPAIVRATAASLLPQNVDPETAKDVATALTTAVSADAPLIRAVSVQAMANIPDLSSQEAVVPLLDDPIRAVRIAAARSAAALNPAGFEADESTVAAFDKALNEYIAAQLALPDHPEGHFNIGQLYAEAGQYDLAEIAWQTALAQDPGFSPASESLARYYYQAGRANDAENVYRQALALSPQGGRLHYSLALLLAELKRTDEAARHLERAASLLANDVRVQYNYGLLLLQMGETTRAESTLQTALALDPENRDIVFALASLYGQEGRWDEAHRYATILLQLAPDVPAYQQLFELIEKKLSGGG